MKVLAFVRQRSFARYVTLDLAEAARALGWPVLWLDLEGRLLVHRDRPRAERERVVADILDEIRTFQPDLVFSYGLEYLAPVFADFDAGVPDRLASLVGRPAAYFVFDFGDPFDRPLDERSAPVVAALQSHESAMFCWDREALATLKSYSIARAFYFPMAVNPNIFFRDEEAARDPRWSADVVFVGGPTPERIAALEPLGTRGLRVYGYEEDAWRASTALASCYAGPLLARPDARRAYSGAKISVNVTRPHGPSSLNMRVYESMACGSLLLTEDRGDARRLFTDGRELVLYSDHRDLVEKVDYYLAHEEERAAIADAGRRRVLHSHTYERRLREYAPMLVKFHAEWSTLCELSNLVTTDAARAVVRAAAIEANGEVTAASDALDCLAAEAALQAGDLGAVEARALRVLGRLPRHLHAAALLGAAREP